MQPLLQSRQFPLYLRLIYANHKYITHKMRWHILWSSSYDFHTPSTDKEETIYSTAQTPHVHPCFRVFLSMFFLHISVFFFPCFCVRDKTEQIILQQISSRCLQVSATEIILTLGQAFEVAFQLAMKVKSRTSTSSLSASMRKFVDDSQPSSESSRVS